MSYFFGMCTCLDLTTGSIVFLDADNTGQHLEDLRLTLGSLSFTMHYDSFIAPCPTYIPYQSRVVLRWNHSVQISYVILGHLKHFPSLLLNRSKNELPLDMSCPY